MGKQWYRGGKSYKRPSGHVLVDRDGTNNDTTGCMCAVFQLFDFPHFISSAGHTSTAATASFELPEAPNIPNGAQAPRNSLKSEEENSLIEDEELQCFNSIQMRINQIKTSCGNGGNNPPSRSSAKSAPRLSPAAEISSDASINSPATKTPTLVARLMGLDLLPESTNSPTHTYQNISTKPHSHTNPGTRSLPETPRISSARRSDSDIHHRRRLSLQINKENAGTCVSADDLDLSRLSSLTRKHLKSDHQHQNQEKYYYETRRAGLDITNTSREYDLHKSHAKSKRSSSKLEEQVITSNKDQSFQLCSSLSSSSPAPATVKPKPAKPKQRITQEETCVIGPKKKIDQANYKRADINVPEKIKCKKTTLPINLLSLNVVPTFFPGKKAAKDVDDQLKLPHKVQPSAEIPPRNDAQGSTSRSPSSPSHNNNSGHVYGPRDTSSAKNDAFALRHYVTKILGRAGIFTTSHVSFSHWFSPSYPLDPSIFHRLELHYSDSNIFLHTSRQYLLSPKSNRKLVFDVVNELLSEILRPSIINSVTNNNNNNSSNIVSDMGMQGKDLIKTLCSLVEGFPCKDCQVLEDIDALIDQDLCDRRIMIRAQEEIDFEEEGEALVMEIEKCIVDSLVRETAIILLGIKS